ncbi:hypothetical protein B9Z19DRAFT_975088, partial [Tuber borchii]
SIKHSKFIGKSIPKVTADPFDSKKKQYFEMYELTNSQRIGQSSANWGQYNIFAASHASTLAPRFAPHPSAMLYEATTGTLFSHPVEGSVRGSIRPTPFSLRKDALLHCGATCSPMRSADLSALCYWDPS